MDIKVNLALRAFGLGLALVMQRRAHPTWAYFLYQVASAASRLLPCLPSAPGPPFSQQSHDVWSVFLLFGFLPTEARSASPEHSWALLTDLHWGPAELSFKGIVPSLEREIARLSEEAQAHPVSILLVAFGNPADI